MAGMSNAHRSDSSGDSSANPASPANDATGSAPASPASPAPAPEGLTPGDPGFRRALIAVLFAGIASFQALYAGVPPARALAAYAVISYMDTVAGVFVPRGGVHALPRAMAAAAEAAGGRFRWRHEVVRLERRGDRITAVHTAPGERRCLRNRRRPGPRGEILWAEMIHKGHQDQLRGGSNRVIGKPRFRQGHVLTGNQDVISAQRPTLGSVGHSRTSSR